MKTLYSKEDVYALLFDAPTGSAALGAAIKTGLLWMLAEKPMDADAIKKANVLIFLMDNVGYGDLGIYGGGLKVGAPTPNMDRLGREGLQLLSTYSQPSCTPSRCTLLTGRLPMRHGQLRASFAGEEGSLSSEITLPTLLSKAGYVTQGVGKWHCGEDQGSQPQNVGFDDFYGFLGWSGLYTDWQDVEFAPEFALNPDRQAWVQTVPFDPHIVHGVKGQPRSAEGASSPTCVKASSNPILDSPSPSTLANALGSPAPHRARRAYPEQGSNISSFQPRKRRRNDHAVILTLPIGKLAPHRSLRRVAPSVCALNGQDESNLAQEN